MKYTSILFLALLSFAVLSSCSQQNPSTSQAVDSSISADSIQTPSNEVIFSLISAIPDHGIHDSPQKAFTPEYYSLLIEAWAIPNDCPGEIGSNEWLFYFTSGNGDGWDHVENITTSLKGSQAIVKYDCVYSYPNTPNDHHQMILQFNDNHWIIADYDNTKAELLKYIRQQRDYFRSSKWQSHLQSLDYLSDQQKQEAQQDVDNYFQQYPNDR